MKKIAAAIILFALIGCIQKVENQNQPNPSDMPVEAVNKILLNGYENLGEWLDDLKIDTTFENVHIKAKADSEYVYFNIRDLDTVHTGVDLYIANESDDAFIFHVSSAHGLRMLVDTNYVDQLWGGQKDWSANLIQIVVENEQQVFKAPDIFEYQISRSYFSDDFKLMIGFKRPDKKVPETAVETDPGTWLSLNLN